MPRLFGNCRNSNLLTTKTIFIHVTFIFFPIKLLSLLMNTLFQTVGNHFVTNLENLTSAEQVRSAHL